MKKTYRFRLYPSQRQKQCLFSTFEVCKQIYNMLLKMTVKTYNSEGRILRRFEYNRYLTGKYVGIHSQVKQNVSDRVHNSFQNFFRRVRDRSCKRKGFPRFKSRVNSITYPQSGFKFVSDKRLYVSKIGIIPIVLHRDTSSKLKTMTIKVNRVGQWFAIFACEIDTSKVECHPSDRQVGIDMGLEYFATLSSGIHIENPRYIVKAERRLKRLQRHLSRKKIGSKNRQKAKNRLAKQHVKVADQRWDFLHKTAYQITQKYSFIAVEKLSIKNMMRNHHLARSIGDASWNSFVQMLSYKAVTRGGQLVKVNPWRTSKTCSNCKTIIDMPLHKRRFSCPCCGFVCHRDVNAAVNILKVGQDLPEVTPVDRSASATKFMVVSGLFEAGTI